MSFLPRVSGSIRPLSQTSQHLGRQSISAKYSLAKSQTVARLAQRVAGVEFRASDLHSTQRPRARLFSSADVTLDAFKLLTVTELTRENTDFHDHFVISSRNGEAFDTRIVKNLTSEDISRTRSRG
jgi:UTP:GlnB (protein PII) uridylyltransferase